MLLSTYIQDVLICKHIVTIVIASNHVSVKILNQLNILLLSLNIQPKTAWVLYGQASRAISIG